MSVSRLLLNPRHLLPLMIFVGVLIVGVRVGDVWDAAASGKMFTRSAQAETKSDAAPAPVVAPATSGASVSTVAPPVEKSVSPVRGLTSPSDDSEVSPAEMEVLKQLSDRREQLEKRGRDLDVRESLIKVAEQRVDQKITEMEKLRLQLQSMINQVGEAQAVQIENLVKIYETMKPKEAARIFETLDMPVLLGVIQRMKPARTAPIMAEMAPEKAKELTVALTKQDQLPQLK